MIWVVVAIIVAIVVLAATLVDRDDPFKTAATDLGLELSRSVPELMPRLDGMIDGIAFKIDIAGSREPGVRYRAFYPALGMALRLERETTISRTLGQLGNGDRTIGATEFDQRFRINTSRPDALKTMMTPELRRRLVELVDRYPAVVVRDGEIDLQTSDAKPGAPELVATSRDLAAVARMLDAARPAPLPKPNAAAPGVPAPATHQPVEERTSQPEPAQEAAIGPDDDVVPVAYPERPPVTSGLPAGFFDDAFGANRLSFEKDDRFDAIKGTTLTLSGTVKQSTDAVGEAGGTKVIVNVAQIDNELYGKTDIDAVVYLTEPADLHRGQNIIFTGTADGIDAFMRNLFVKDAALIE